jgi:hypothetical protein
MVQGAARARGWAVLLLAFLVASVTRAPATAEPQQRVDRIIACCVLETHTTKEPAATVVFFHQRDKQDQARLAPRLRGKLASAVEMQAGEGAWQRGTVVRSKGRFGRGLLILAEDVPAPLVGETLMVRFPAGSEAR